MSFFSTLLADVEGIWANIFGKSGATISAAVVEDIQLIGSGLSGALSGFETITGISPAAVAKIEGYVTAIEAGAASVATTVAANVAKPIATQIATDFSALETALGGITLPAVIQSVLSAVKTLLPYVEAGVGILTAASVKAAEETGMTVDEARLILAAKK